MIIVKYSIKIYLSYLVVDTIAATSDRFLMSN